MKKALAYSSVPSNIFMSGRIIAGGIVGALLGGICGLFAVIILLKAFPPGGMIPILPLESAILPILLFGFIGICFGMIFAAYMNKNKDI